MVFLGCGGLDAPRNVAALSCLESLEFSSECPSILTAAPLSGDPAQDGAREDAAAAVALSELAAMGSLREMRISHMLDSIYGVLRLSPFSSLRVLELLDCDVSPVDVSGLTNLRTLVVSASMSCVEVRGVPSLSSLRFLDLVMCRLPEGYSCVSSLTSLRHISVEEVSDDEYSDDDDSSDNDYSF